MSEEILYRIIKVPLNLKVSFYSCNSDCKMTVSSFFVNPYTKKLENFLRMFLPYYQRGCSFKNLQFVIVIVRRL
jgi:hypothetical protein